MDKKYRTFIKGLEEDMLSNFRQPRETLDLGYLLKGQCRSWSIKLAEEFPELTTVRGFYDDCEHVWCVTGTGEIVDATVGQFRVGVGDPAKYRVFNPEVDEILLGRCMDCGEYIYGLESQGQQSICPPEEGEETSACQRATEDYFNSLIAASRG